MLQIFAIIDDTLVMNLGKICNTTFRKMRGGGQWPFGTFPKIHPFWKGNASLMVTLKKVKLFLGTKNRKNEQQESLQERAQKWSF